MASLADRLFTFARVVASSIGAQNGSVQVNLRVSAEDDEEGQDGSTEEPLFTGPAMIRPLDPTDDGAAEAFVARVTDGLQPIALRDLRLSKARGAMGKGVTTLPGYGGAFVSVDYQPASATDTVTIYVPDDSDPKKASCITITKDQLLVLHKLGAYIALLPDGKISLVSPDGKSFITVSNAGVALSGPLKTVTGALFGDAVTAVPLVIAPVGSQAWFEQATFVLNAVVATLVGAVPGTPLVTGTISAALALHVPPLPAGVIAPLPTITTKASASP